MLYLLQIGHCAAAVSTGAQRGIHIFLDKGQVIACSQLVLQEKRRTNAAELAMRNDSNSIPQNVCLIHVVCGKNDSAAWKKAKEDTTVKSTTLVFPSQERPLPSGFCHEGEWEVCFQVVVCLNKVSHMEKSHNCYHKYIFPTICTSLPHSAEVG